MRRASLITLVGLALAFLGGCSEEVAPGIAPGTQAQHLPTKIWVPRLELAEPVTWYVNRGPAWWRRTGRPGGGDTIAIAGHRVTHSRPFRHLGRLQRGDLIRIRWKGRMYRYIVTGRRVLPGTDLHIADAVGHERLLLSACHPPGSAKYRLVVYARPEL